VKDSIHYANNHTILSSRKEINQSVLFPFLENISWQGESFRGTLSDIGYNFGFPNYEIEFELCIKITSRWFVKRYSEFCLIVMVWIADGEYYCLFVHRQHALYMYVYCLWYAVKAASMITHMILFGWGSCHSLVLSVLLADISARMRTGWDNVWAPVVLDMVKFLPSLEINYGHVPRIQRLHCMNFVRKYKVSYIYLDSWIGHFVVSL
jgi:hypothetical protein